MVNRSGREHRWLQKSPITTTAGQHAGGAKNLLDPLVVACTKCAAITSVTTMKFKKTLQHVVRWTINIWVFITFVVNIPFVFIWHLLLKAENKLNKKGS
jgi:type IV secretory pathway VirB3-like protein